RPRSAAAAVPGPRRSLVHPGLLDPAADLGEVVPMLAGILPPPVELANEKPALLRVRTVHVRDLELSPAGGLERVDAVEDVGRIAVETDHGVARRRGVESCVDHAGLLDDVENPPAVAVRDDTEVLRVGDLLDEDLGLFGVLPPGAQGLA